MADDKKFSEWHGVPREKIKWNPAVDEKKCVGCGMCATGCGRNVYGWSFEKKQAGGRKAGQLPGGVRNLLEHVPLRRDFIPG